MTYALKILHYHLERERAFADNLDRVVIRNDPYWNWQRAKAVEHCRELREAIEVLEGREERTLFNNIQKKYHD